MQVALFTTRDAAMDATQRYSMDTAGYCVVVDALCPSQTAALREVAHARCTPLGTNSVIAPRVHCEADEGGFWSKDYYELVDHPLISPILDELYAGDNHRQLVDPTHPSETDSAPMFRLDHINVHTHAPADEAREEGWHRGGPLHAGNSRLIDPDTPREMHSCYFSYDHGTFSNGLVSVSYELDDTVANGGGFGTRRHLCRHKNVIS